MSRKVAIYARVSTEHEAQISALENQVQYYTEILERHPEFELYDRYIDEGITGTSVKKRPSFLRMIEDAKNGCFDLIITREVSRFARNTVDTLQETRKLKALGVEVWFTEDNIWTMDDSDGELRLTIMATLAQNESKKTSMRVKAGQMISFKNGVPYGNGNILGYDKLPNHGGYVINKEQAETVRLIYDLYLSGKGLRAIQFELEQQGRKTAMGLPNWNCAVIARILKNPFYCGIIEYRKQYVPDFLEQKKVNNKGAVERIRVKGTHEPIVSEAEYTKVMSIIGSRIITSDEGKKTKGIRDHTDVWGKVLVCSCGKRFRRVKYHTPKGTEKRCAYQCGGQLATGSVSSRLKKGLPIEGVCDSQFVQDWKLDVMAATIFKQFFENPQAVIKYANELLEAKTDVLSKQQEKENEIERIRIEMDKIEKKIGNLLDLRLSEDISRDEYVDKRAELEKLLAEANKKIDELENYQAIEESIEDRASKIKSIIENKGKYEFAHIPDEVIDAFVDKIVVHKDFFEWHMFFDNYSMMKVEINGNKRNHDIICETTPDVNGSTGCNQAQGLIQVI